MFCDFIGFMIKNVNCMKLKYFDLIVLLVVSGLYSDYMIVERWEDGIVE